jgi:hypothetical protein
MILRPSLCAVLDILGFSEAIRSAYSNGTEKQLLSEISKSLNTAADHIKSLSKPKSPLKVKFFTDSVVIGFEYWTESAKGELQDICSILADYQLTMACKGLFTRGGISVGTLAIDDAIVFGDSLLEAHKLESSVARTPRIILDVKLKDTVKRIIPSATEVERNTWKFLLMQDVDDFFFVNYLQAVYDEPKPDPKYGMAFHPNLDLLKAHQEQVEFRLNKHRQEPEKWSKYFWVANYHNSFCERIGLTQLRIHGLVMQPQPVILESD